MDTACVTCVTCGFLAKQPVQPNYPRRWKSSFFEVDPDQRAAVDTVYTRPSSTPQGPTLRHDLRCFRRVIDIDREIAGVPPRADGVNVPHEAAARIVVEIPRRCAEWTPYVTGLDPKDHLMDRRLADLEEDRRRFERALNRVPRALMWTALLLGAFQVLAAFLVMGPDAWVVRWLSGAWR